MFAQTPYGGRPPDAGFEKVRRGRDDVLGHDAILDHAPCVVQIVDEVVQCLEPLNQAALDARPFRSFDRARNDVERPRAVDILTFRVNGERDAHLDDGALGIRLPLGELAHAKRRKVRGELDGRRACIARCGEELVVEPARLILIPVDAHRFGVTIRATTR